MVKYRLFYSLAKHRALATMAKDVASADSSGLFDLSSAAGNKSLSALWAVSRAILGFYCGLEAVVCNK